MMFCTCNNGVMYSYSSVNKSKVGFFHLFKMNLDKNVFDKKCIYIYKYIRNISFIELHLNRGDS